MNVFEAWVQKPKINEFSLNRFTIIIITTLSVQMASLWGQEMHKNGWRAAKLQ